MSQRHVSGIAGRALTRGVDQRERSHSLRTVVFQSRIGLVENFQSATTPQESRAEGFSPEFQVCLPYAGLFVWHVGGEHIVADANQVLFVRGGEPFHVSGPIASRYGELIMTPPLEVLAELAGTTEARLTAHPLFRRRRRCVTLAEQALRARILHLPGSHDQEGLDAEELALTLLRSSLQIEDPSYEPRATTRRMVHRAKEFIEANLSTPLRLSDVSRAVNASPAYLTDLFRRVEGVPLHRYVLQLRLAHALVDLPHVTDLTTLALDLGFSSHSHFAASFRRAFGCTPSQFRESTRATQQKRIA
jgi:AraC-like DNA-binding protein